MTLREYINSLPPDQQQAFMDELTRRASYQRAIAEHPVLSRAKYLAEGAGAGFTNALYGAVTAPLAITNAVGLTDFEAPKKPLVGPGGSFLNDPRSGAGVGPWYGVGNVGGFAASFATGAGELKAAAEASKITKAAIGALNFATGTALRSQGDVGERLLAGAEAAPLGAATGFAHLPRATGQGLPDYIFKQSVRMGAAGAVAGAVTPGARPPVEATSIPVIDNFLFNAAFGAVSSVRATEPVVPGRERAQDTTRPAATYDAAVRMRAGDMQRSVDEQASIEAAVRATFPEIERTTPPGLGRNLFGETQGEAPTLNFGPEEIPQAMPLEDAVIGAPNSRYQMGLFGPELKPEFVSSPRVAEGPLPPTRPEELFAETPPEVKSEERPLPADSALPFNEAELLAEDFTPEDEARLSPQVREALANYPGPPEAAPVEVKTTEAQPLPDYLRESMLARGLDPNRPLNDVDLQNKSVRDAIMNDPTLTEEQKQQVLRTGSPERRAAPSAGPRADYEALIKAAEAETDPRRARVALKAAQDAFYGQLNDRFKGDTEAAANAITMSPRLYDLAGRLGALEDRIIRKGAEPPPGGEPGAMGSSPSPRTFAEKVDLLKSQGINQLTEAELLREAPKLGGLGGLAQHLGLSGRGTTTELAQRILSHGRPDSGAMVSPGPYTVRNLRPEPNSAHDLEQAGHPPVPVGTPVLARVNGTMRPALVVMAGDPVTGVLPESPATPSRYYTVTLLNEHDITALRHGILPSQLIDTVRQVHADFQQERAYALEHLRAVAAKRGGQPPTDAELNPSIDTIIAENNAALRDKVIKALDDIESGTRHAPPEPTVGSNVIWDNLVPHSAQLTPSGVEGATVDATNVYLIRGSDLGLPSLRARLDRAAAATVASRLRDGLAAADALSAKRVPSPAALDAKVTIERQLRSELAQTQRAIWAPDLPLRVVIAAPTDVKGGLNDPNFSAAMYPDRNILVLSLKYFLDHPTDRLSVLLHEAVHEAAMRRNIAKLGPERVAALFQGAGYPVTLDIPIPRRHNVPMDELRRVVTPGLIDYVTAFMKGKPSEQTQARLDGLYHSSVDMERTAGMLRNLGQQTLDTTFGPGHQVVEVYTYNPADPATNTPSSLRNYLGEFHSPDPLSASADTFFKTWSDGRLDATSSFMRVRWANGRMGWVPFSTHSYSDLSVARGEPRGTALVFGSIPFSYLNAIDPRSAYHQSKGTTPKLETIPPVTRPIIQDSHYGNWHPAEFLSNLAEARAALRPSDFTSTFPGANHLLNATFGGPEHTFVFGASQNDARQRRLLPEIPQGLSAADTDLGGPRRVIISWRAADKIDLKSATNLTTRAMRAGVEDDHPWALAANTLVKSDNKGGQMTQAQKAAEELASTYLVHLGRKAEADRIGATREIASQLHDLILDRVLAKDAENPPVVEGQPGSQRKSVVRADLRKLVKLSEGKDLINRVMLEAKARADLAARQGEEGETLGGIETLADTEAARDFSRLADAEITQRVRRNAALPVDVAQFRERIDPVKEERLRSLFADGLAGVMANRSLDATMKKILIWRYGAAFKNPDGSPLSTEMVSIGTIARRLGTTERNVRARIQSFAGTGKSDSRLVARITNPVDVKQPELFPGLRPAATVEPPEATSPDNNLVRGGVVIPSDNPAYDYVAWKNQANQIDRATGEVIATARSSRRGTGRTVITDLKTGKKIVQEGLFDNRRAAYAEADRESLRPEPVAGPEPAPLTAQEHVMDAALGEAAAGPLATAALKGQEAASAKEQAGGITPAPPALLGLFGESTGIIKPTSRLGEFATFTRARAKIGASRMTDEEFASLHIDQQLRHAILRLSSAANLSVYSKTLAKYARLLNAHASESGTKVPFPTLNALVAAGKAAKRGLPRQGWMDALRARANELGVNLTLVNPAQGANSQIRLVEPETGREVLTRDVGTAAMFLDARSRRISEAVDLMPPGFSHLKIFLPPDGGAPFGPPPPPDAPSAPDAQASGRPPDIPESAQRSFGDAFFSQIRPVMNVAASLARKFKNPEIALAARHLLTMAETGRNHAQSAIQRRIALMRRYNISPRRQEILGNAAADVDVAGETYLKSHGNDLPAAIAHINSIEDSIYAAHGLRANEISYLKAMRAEWDRLFRLFDIGVTQYIPGYFTRWTSPSPDNGTVALNTTFPTTVPFFARLYRKGHLTGRSYRYNDIFDHYARQGFREKYISTAPGSGTLSPVERMESVLRQYELRSVRGTVTPFIELTDDAGTATGRITKQFEPLVRLVQVARGLPDTRRLNAVEAQAGVTKLLSDLTDARTQAAVDRAFIPFHSQLRAAIKSYHDSLQVKLSERTYDTWLDTFTRLHRARTFGLHFGRTLRNMITDGPFFVLPRVGPKYYGAAISDLLNPAIGPNIYRRAYALNVIKPAFPIEYISTTNRLLTWADKLSFMFSYGDHWGRAVAFRAQELKTRDAALAYQRHGSLDRFIQQSGLSQLDPAWHPLVTEPLLRGNIPVAIREHARLLADTALFDYTNANAPLAFRGVWGRFLGQYAIWPINMVEALPNMVRWGTREQKLKTAALYAAAAAATYGMGQALGIKTAQWIPFIHSAVYTGGPGLGLAVETQEALAGDPATQQRLLSDLRHDPTAFFLGGVTKNLIPAGDVLRVLAAQTNMSRRRRRLLGIPRPEANPANRTKRLLGFTPADARPSKAGPLAQQLVALPFNKLTE